MKTKTVARKSSTSTAAAIQRQSGQPFFQKNGEAGSSASAAFFQAKLKIGQPGDRFEREADAMADQVVNRSSAPRVQQSVPSSVQGKCADCTPQGEERQKEEEKVQAKPLFGQISPLIQRMANKEAEEEVQAKMEEEEPVQRQAEGEEEEEVQAKMKEEEEPLQRQADEEEEVQAKMEEEEPVQRQAEGEEEEEVQAKSTFIRNGARRIEQSLRAAKGGGRPLANGLRSELESQFGADFGGVRIHTDSTAAQMSQDINAQAFTHQNDIFFNRGKFDPDSPQGMHLLAHELTHTIQQGAAPQKETPIAKGGQFDDSPVEEPIIVPLDGPTESLPEAEAPSVEPETEVPDAASPPEEGTVEETPQAETPTPRSPEDDPNFEALKERSAATAKGQKAHPASDTLADNAGEAAPVPNNEKAGQAQANQVDEMNEEEPKLFDAKGFKDALMAAIAKVLPKDEEEADQFPESGAMGQVQDDASQKVEAEKQHAAGAMQQTSAKEPDTAAVPDRPVAELKTPQTGNKPGTLGAGQAMPPPRNDSEVSQPLAENSKAVDDQMAAANVTDEQLAKSEEPTFKGALASKNTAQEHAATAPVEFRSNEQGMLESRQQQSENISHEQVAGMFGDRKNLLSKATGDQQLASKNNTSERERIASEIDKIYQRTKTDVEKYLGKPDGTEGLLDIGVNIKFEAAAARANANFESFVRKEMDDYKEERYGSWFDPRGWGKRIKDTFVGMPPEVNEIYVRAREKYLADMDRELTTIAEFIADSLVKVKARIAKGRQEVKDYVDSQPAHLKKIAGEAAKEIQDKFDELDDAVISKQEDLIDSLAQQYKDSLAEVDAKIEEMKAANRGLIDKAMDAINGIIDTINKLRQLISDLLSAIASLIDVIMADPIDFMKTLFAGITQGIDNFKANVQKHLVAGLFSWLTGALGPMGITIPDNLFSLSGIFNLIMQVLGLGWDFIRKKMLMIMPEPAVKAIETSFEIFKIIREKGIDGLWEFVQQQFTDLKETVIEAIKNMLITQVIQAGIKWLLSLLIPGAGFIKAIMAIKDVVVFFVESAIMLIPALIDGIKAAAAKNFGGIAKAIEEGIGRLIPLIIGLLARLIGISGLAGKVQKIIKKIKKRIDKQVNKLILKAKKWVKKVWGKGKKVAGKVKEKVFSWWKIKNKIKAEDGSLHALEYRGKGKFAKLLVKSAPTPVDTFLKPIPKILNNLSGKEKDKKQKSYEKAVAINKIIHTLEEQIGKATPDKKQTYFQKLNKGHSDLAKNLAPLFNLQKGEIPPAVLPPFVNGIKAHSIKAKFISNDSSKTPVGQNSSAHKGNLVGWEKLVEKGLRKKENWVKMHLLHHKLGGKATDSNLTPSKSSINKRFYDKLERSAVESIKTPANIIWYKVDINYHTTQKDYISNIQASYGLHLKGEGWKEGPPIAAWGQTVEPPIFDNSSEVVSLNDSGKKILSRFKFENRKLENKFIDMLIEERNKSFYSEGFKPYTGINDLLTRLQVRYPGEKSVISKNITTISLAKMKGNFTI